MTVVAERAVEPLAQPARLPDATARGHPGEGAPIRGTGERVLLLRSVLTWVGRKLMYCRLM